MIHLLPTLRWPWRRHTPATRPQVAATASVPVQSPDWWALLQPALRRRILAGRTPSCWNCGHPGVTFCPVECDTPLIVKNPTPWKPALPFAYVPRVEPVDAAEEAADARLAAHLDREEAA